MVIAEGNEVGVRLGERTARLERSALIIERSRVRRASAARRLELSREYLAMLTERRARLAAALANEPAITTCCEGPRLTRPLIGGD